MQPAPLTFMLPLVTIAAAAASPDSPACDASDESTVKPVADLYDPSARDAHYSGNIARYLVDLHDARATFDFVRHRILFRFARALLLSLRSPSGTSAYRRPPACS